MDLKKKIIKPEHSIEHDKAVYGTFSTWTCHDNSAELALEKYIRRKKIWGGVWKVGKSILIASGGAGLTALAQFLEIRLAENYPMATQGVLSVAIAAIKAAVGVINKL